MAKEDEQPEGNDELVHSTSSQFITFSILRIVNISFIDLFDRAKVQAVCMFCDDC